MSQSAKIFVLGISLLFIFTLISFTGQTSPLINEDSSVNEDENLDIDTQNQGYWVMDFIPESPPDEISRKPKAESVSISEFNWMDHNGKDWTTPARNQGYCGSCWAFAAVSCLESVINIAWDDAELDIDLSEQYILSCLSRAGSCGGGNSYSALKYIMNNDSSGNDCNGVITEDCLEYQADDSVLCSQKSDDWRQKLVPLSNYGYWQPNFPEDIDAIKTELMNRGPLITYFLATGSFSRWGSSHHSPDDYYPFEEADGANHAVIIVGFKDDLSIENGGYWICKNSWGTEWGYNGFFNIEYGSLNIDDIEITWAEYSPGPIVDCSLTPFNPMAGEEISFTDLSNSLKGEIVTWHYDFGDGTVSTLRNPKKVYDEIGVYTLTLTVTNSLGKTSSLSKKIYVGDEDPPVSNYYITGIKGDNEWYLSHVGIRLSAFDSFSDVDRIMFNLDGGGYQRYVRSLILSGSSYEGVHTISYYAIDKSGNKEEEKSFTFKIDCSDPEVSIIKPSYERSYFFNLPFPSTNDVTTVIGPLIPKCEIIDDVSGIERVEFYLNNRLVDTDYNPPYRYIVNRIHLGKECSFMVKVVDNSGRSTLSETLYFKQFSFGLIRNIL
jgi:PKD repeat protein